MRYPVEVMKYKTALMMVVLYEDKQWRSENVVLKEDQRLDNCCLFEFKKEH